MKSLFIITLLSVSTMTFGQKNFNDYAQFYPISDDANIRWMTSYTKQETILFEANPIVRFSFYNDFLKKMASAKHSKAWYLSYRSQLRMYLTNSNPVRMPSYRIFLGTQHMFRLTPPNQGEQKFWGFSFESGHYSNGQDNSAFSEQFADGSPQSDSIYRTITSSTKLSEILNRRSGNFSTNLTEIILNYRTYQLDDDNIPGEMCSFNLGYLLYHDKFWGIANFGGYSDNDIKLYGRHRFSAGFEYMRVIEKETQKRYHIKLNAELISEPHPSVNPIRTEAVFRYFPFKKSKGMGLFVSYIYGHDNYNFRFVDSGHQGSIGLTWDQFPPFTMGTIRD